MRMFARNVFGLATSLAALAGCVADVPPPDPAAAFAGRWVGFYESSLGILGCPARGPLDVTVESGAVRGNAQADSFVMTLDGALGPDGALRDGVFRRDGRAAAIVTGTFADSAAAGRWQGASCEGVWTLRRAPR